MIRIFAPIFALSCAHKGQPPTIDSFLDDVGQGYAAPVRDSSSEDSDSNACMLDEQWNQQLWNVGVSAFMSRNSARWDDRDSYMGMTPWDESRWKATRMNGNVEEFVMVAGNIDFFPKSALDQHKELARASQLTEGSGVRLELQHPSDFNAYAVFLAMNGRTIIGVRILPASNHTSEYQPPGVEVSCTQATAWAVRVLEASTPYVSVFPL